MKEMPKRAWLRRPKEDETRTNANVIGWQDYRGWEDETLYIRADLHDALRAENERLRSILDAEPTPTQLADAALHRRHDFGLLPKETQWQVMDHAATWLNAWRHVFRDALAQEDGE